MTTSNELLSLVARASDLLGSTLDPSEVVWSLARLVVPSLADWSIITLVSDDGTLADVEAWHHEPARRQITRIFAEHRYGGRTEQAGSLSALASGEPFVVASGAREFARTTLRSPVALEALAELELESAVVVPMLAGGRVIGLITLCRGPERAAMTAAELDVTVDIARRASVTFSRARSYERQRTSSEQLQRSLLTEPMRQPDLEVVTRYVPAADEAQIGGDWYDVFTQPDGATVLVVGDVAGHDMTAAAMMGQLRSMLRGIGVTTGSGPARLLTELDRAIEALGLDASATAAVVRLRLDGDGARLAYSNAGHPAPLLAHPDGSVEALGEHDTLLGVVPGEQRQQVDVVLQPGGTLLLFSDGLVERRTEDIDVGHAALEQLLGRVHDAPLEQLVDRLVTDLLPAVHDDDVAVLAVRLRG